MWAALVIHRVLPDIDANLAAILHMANEAADAGADLVVFPEAALTGLINNDDPSHDLPLGQVIPGPVTDVLAGLARERHIWLAIGLLEREGHRLYDSAVLLTPDGDIGLKYRRIQPRWHGKRADPDGSYDQERWDREEKPTYVQQVRLAGVTTLMINYLADRNLLGGSFGGAMVVLSDGTVVDSFPLSKVGILVVEVCGSYSGVS